MNDELVRQIGPGLFQIDLHFLGEPGVIASYLLVGDDGEAALVETGPTTTLERLLGGVRAAGIEPDAITRVLVTHIHLDHAGGAGVLLDRLPGATLFVHPVGAPHLVEPGKLIASATRIYGQAMDRLWGEFRAVRPERLRVVEDGYRVRAGGRTLHAVDTPGHASHHLAFHEIDEGLVFTGDVGGVRLAESTHIRPPTPPPDLDLAAWKLSIQRIRTLRPERLLLTHFGAFPDAEWHLDELLSQLFQWCGWIEGTLRLLPDPAAVARALGERGVRELVRSTGSVELEPRYELATNYRMTVDGVARYLRKRADRP
jgi:glyoxylase-like metal-dependent hydrolase (beta-lactamase superfamily II)